MLVDGEGQPLSPAEILKSMSHRCPGLNSAAHKTKQNECGRRHIEGEGGKDDRGGGDERGWV